MKLITYDGEEKYLCKSSLFLLVPTVYSYLTGNIFLSVLNLFSTTISCLFWYKPYFGYRRILDKTYQPLYVSFLLYNGFKTISKKNTLPSIIGFSSCFYGLYFFHYASQQYYKPNRLWFVYHNIFHGLMSVSALCLYKCINNDK